MDDDGILRIAVLAEAEEARRGVGAHPTPEELLDYHNSELEGEEKERLQEHLALCRDCTRAMRDLELFPDVEPFDEEHRLSPEQSTASWQRLMAAKRDIATAEDPRAPVLPFLSSPKPGYALAASLAVIALGIAGWVIHVAELSRPRANVHIADLVPQQDALVRGAAEPVQVPAEAEHVLLILNLANYRSFPAYRVAITDQQEQEIWSSREFRRSSDGNFTVEVGRRLLPAGEYRIALDGLDGEFEMALAVYTVAVEYE